MGELWCKYTLAEKKIKAGYREQIEKKALGHPHEPSMLGLLTSVLLGMQLGRVNAQGTCVCST